MPPLPCCSCLDPDLGRRAVRPPRAAGDVGRWHQLASPRCKSSGGVRGPFDRMPPPRGPGRNPNPCCRTGPRADRRKVTHLRAASRLGARMDGLPDREPNRTQLVYPFEGPPARGTTTEVAPGVHWIRMPLPYALNHINLWALDDGQGWALVDTGVRNEETALAWRELFANAPDTRPLTRIFVTHMHPDHVGMAGWLTRKFGVRLWMTPLEYLSCRVMVSDSGREAPTDAI